MLVELRVRNLGVIEDLTLDLGAGLTALTGETGAGKTLVVEAIELLVGGRSESVLVRPGSDEAVVEGRFLRGEDETVLSRTVLASGRSRAAVDGRMATIAALGEEGAALVDLHGQHAHQSLLRPAAQRDALDAFGAVDLAPLRSARAARAEVERSRDALGGDAQARLREIDLLRFQIEELAKAAVDDPLEDDRLREEEDALADATAHREAAAAAHAVVADEGGALDLVGRALAHLAGRAPLAAGESRLRGLQAELADTAAELRDRAEALEDDPERLAEVRSRRQQLHELRRKYGESLEAVIAYRAEAEARLDELEGREARAGGLDAELAAAVAAEEEAAAAVRASREKAAPRLSRAVEKRLHTLALPNARFIVSVNGDGPGDDVRFELTANPGAPALPLQKVASGGELARVMLALRLATMGDDGPETLVFDEVDAGIGGETAVAVGAALAELAQDRQVLVVTHLPQVAAFADQQIGVAKAVQRGVTVARAAVLDDEARVVELSRMLSGQRDSVTANEHAEELLATARASRTRRGQG